MEVSLLWSQLFGAPVSKKLSALLAKRTAIAAVGGTIGLKFHDDAYFDNVAGSPNSVWDLELV